MIRLQFGTPNPAAAWHHSRKRTLWHRYVYYIGNENPETNNITTKDDIDEAVQAVTTIIHTALDRSTTTNLTNTTGYETNLKGNTPQKSAGRNTIDRRINEFTIHSQPRQKPTSKNTNPTDGTDSLRISQTKSRVFGSSTNSCAAIKTPVPHSSTDNGGCSNRSTKPSTPPIISRANLRIPEPQIQTRSTVYAVPGDGHWVPQSHQDEKSRRARRPS